MKKYSIEDLRQIKGFGKKMEKRLLEYEQKKEEQQQSNQQTLEIETPQQLMVDLDNVYCAESIEFMRKNIPNNFVDLTITSPPYDDLRKYNGYKFDYKAMLKELYRVTKEGGIVVWIVGDRTQNGSESGTSFKQALYAKEIGFNLHDTMIYAKNNPIPLTHNRYEQQFEYMFIFSKGKPKTFNPIKKANIHAGKNKTGTHRLNGDSLKQMNKQEKVKDFSIENNIWFYSVNKGSTTKDVIAHKHPAIFPEQLAQDHILSWSNEGDIVLDPMCGSGTTCKMAFLNNRKFLGVDMSHEYIEEVCIPRLKKYGWKEV
jgi:DNA modification methylase